MEKNSNLKRNIIGGVTLAVLGISIIGGAVYSKYITKISGSGTLPVAKWSFLVNGKDGSNGETLGALDLGEKTYTAETLTSGKIAPGTEGSFDVVIDATGTDTGVDYVVAVKDVTNMPKNMYFVVDGKEYATLDEVATAISGHIDANATSKKITKTVAWKWDYETTTSKDGQRTTLADNDAQDTTDGKSANDFTFTIDVTGTQTAPALK